MDRVAVNQRNRRAKCSLRPDKKINTWICHQNSMLLRYNSICGRYIWVKSRFFNEHAAIRWRAGLFLAGDAPLANPDHPLQAIGIGAHPLTNLHIFDRLIAKFCCNSASGCKANHTRGGCVSPFIGAACCLAQRLPQICVVIIGNRLNRFSICIHQIHGVTI